MSLEGLLEGSSGIRMPERVRKSVPEQWGLMREGTIAYSLQMIGRDLKSGRIRGRTKLAPRNIHLK